MTMSDIIRKTMQKRNAVTPKAFRLPKKPIVQDHYQTMDTRPSQKSKDMSTHTTLSFRPEINPASTNTTPSKFIKLKPAVFQARLFTPVTQDETSKLEFTNQEYSLESMPPIDTLALPDDVMESGVKTAYFNMGE